MNVTVKYARRRRRNMQCPVFETQRNKTSGIVTTMSVLLMRCMIGVPTPTNGNTKVKQLPNCCSVTPWAYRRMQTGSVLVPSSDCMILEIQVNPMRFMSLFESVLIGYQARLKSCQWRLDPVLQWNIICDGIRKAHIAAR